MSEAVLSTPVINFRRTLLSVAIQEERDRNLALLAELNKLKIILQNELKYWKNHNLSSVDVSDDALLRMIYEEKFKKALDLVKRELAILEERLFKDSKTIQLKTNKMSLLINELIKIFDGENGFIYFKMFINSNFDDIFGLKSKELFKIKADFSDVNNIFGNSKFTLLVLFYLLNISCLTDKSMSELLSTSSVLSSSLLLTDIGEFVSEKLITFRHPLQLSEVDKQKLDENSYSFLDREISTFYTIGKGYQFGGYQEQTKGLRYNDQDCSSWICRITSLPRISTVNIVEIIKLKKLCESYDELREICKKSNSLKDLIVKLRGKIGTGELQQQIVPELLTSFETNIERNKELSLININTFIPKDIQDIQAGDILCWKGHTTLITEVKDNNVVFLGFSRDVPQKEGMGYEIMEKEKLLAKPDIVFFSINPRILKQAIQERR
ncbi:MAG: hypothetical protein PHY80_04860 [Rickettsiales bacterium]|nr:hypothetical protein [Rickettsiales bacterium]